MQRYKYFFEFSKIPNIIFLSQKAKIQVGDKIKISQNDNFYLFEVIKIGFVYIFPFKKQCFLKKEKKIFLDLNLYNTGTDNIYDELQKKKEPFLYKKIIKINFLEQTKKRKYANRRKTKNKFKYEI
jgi:hypothetical protein